jgi:putative ABC transport system permease protein
VLLTQGVPIPLALLTARLFGAPGGAVTARIHTRLGVNDLFAGILTTTGLHTITLRLMGGSNIPITDINPVLNWPDLGQGPDGRWPVALTVVVLGQIALPALFMATDFGLALRAIGNNPTMARANAIALQLGLEAVDLKLATAVLLLLAMSLGHFKLPGLNARSGDADASSEVIAPEASSEDA